jgi:hypothetical protein
VGRPQNRHDEFSSFDFLPTSDLTRGYHELAFRWHNHNANLSQVLDKGKPIVRSGRKVMGLVYKIARPPKETVRPDVAARDKNLSAQRQPLATCQRSSSEVSADGVIASLLFIAEWGAAPIPLLEKLPSRHRGS